MPSQHELKVLKSLVTKNESKIFLLVMDGVGGYRTVENPQTELEAARTPNLDLIARRASLGRTTPAMRGVTVGSGPGHLALFGYDPVDPSNDIGRGVLEALGVDYNLRKHEVAARGNFVTLGTDGKITDRRAGRLQSPEGKRVCALMQEAVKEPIDGVSVKVLPVKEYRFCIVLDGEGLDGHIADTDPQKVGLAPLAPRATVDSAAVQRTIAVLNKAIARMLDAMKGEEKANGFTLRGIAMDPGLETLPQRWGLRCAAIASYPLYRGVAKLVGMDVLATGAEIADEFATLREVWDKYDYIFLHVKKTDSYGEDGNRAGKIAIIEEADRNLAFVAEKSKDVVMVAGDHSTPPPMKSHSWHPVPFMLASPLSDVEGAARFCERTCASGTLGTFPAAEIMQLALAHAGKLQKFGA